MGHQKLVSDCRCQQNSDHSWIFRKQLFYSHCFKLIALFFTAAIHTLYLHPFLGLFSLLQNYSSNLELNLQDDPRLLIIYIPLKQLLINLTDYKNNLSMFVAASLLALSTSTFFVFLPALSKIRESCIIMIGIIDLLVFGSLPLLLFSRLRTSELIKDHLNEVLESSHRIFPMNDFMNEAQCTIFTKENIPYCHEIIERSIIPTALVKYLIILCVLTVAYIVVAYIIYWCLKHWPHADNSKIRRSSVFDFPDSDKCRRCQSTDEERLISIRSVPWIFQNPLINKKLQHHKPTVGEKETE